MASCDTFWGSHGCGLDVGHDGPCDCMWTEYDEDGDIVSFEPAGGNCSPPYHGPDTLFFSLHGQPTPPQTLEARMWPR